MTSAQHDLVSDGLENSLRRRVLANPILRSIARGIVHLQPRRLGQVSEAWHGIFGLRVHGLRLKYQVGPRDTIGNILLWCGPRHFEAETLPTFVERARTARGVLDIGANTGLFSLIACAANPAARVIAWEPVPYLHAKFLANLKANGFSERCQVRSNAVSDAGGTATLYVPEETTTASLNPAHKGEGSTPLEVKLETVDEAVPPDFPVDLIKLDVETHEYQTLCGMRKTLEKWKPAVVFECLPTLAPEPIEKLFRDLGYRLHRLTKAGPEAIDHIDPKQTTDQNFLALFG